MTSTIDKPLRLSRLFEARKLCLLFIFIVTGSLQGLAQQSLKSPLPPRSISAVFNLNPISAQIWRRTGEGQTNFLGSAGEKVNIGLSPKESQGERDILIEFSVPLWGSEWRSDTHFFSLIELQGSTHHPSQGKLTLPLSSWQLFQAYTRASPFFFLGSFLTIIFSISFLNRRFRTSKAKPLIEKQLTLGEYRLEERLGQGGMGEVWAARDLNGDPYAIKIIRTSLSREAKFRRQFDQEISICLKLKHPNLVPIYAFGVTEDGRVYLVNRKLEGQTLRELIDKGSLDSPRIAAETLEQIGSALTYLHQEQHVHCDVKPSNIFVDKQGKFWLMDLGVTRSLGDIDKNRKNWGTPAYMPPEQDAGQPTPQSDQYALGVSLFELLCGRKPFLATERESLRRLHRNENIPSLRTLEPRISQDIENGICKMLSKQVEHRFKDIGEVRESLSEKLLLLKWGS